MCIRDSYWDMYSRGLIIGLTRGTGRAHIVRAALESIAYQSADLVSAIDVYKRQPLIKTGESIYPRLFRYGPAIASKSKTEPAA